MIAECGDNCDVKQYKRISTNVDKRADASPAETG